MKTSELTGWRLAYWVARIVGADLGPEWHQGDQVMLGGHSGTRPEYYTPYEDWAQGGPLLDEYTIGFRPLSDAEWLAEEYITGRTGRGSTPLIAAMRALIFSVYGETVEDEPA